MSLIQSIKKKVADSILYWSEKGLGVKMVSDEIALQRLDICHKCPNYDQENDTCTICHCIMQVKTKLETDPIESVKKLHRIKTQCPASPQKWGAYLDSENTGLPK